MPMLGTVNLVEHEGTPGHGQAISTVRHSASPQLAPSLRFNDFKTQDLAFKRPRPLPVDIKSKMSSRRPAPTKAGSKVARKPSSKGSASTTIARFMAGLRLEHVQRGVLTC